MSEHDSLALHVDALRKRWLDASEPVATQQRILSTLRARRARKRRVLCCLLCFGMILPIGSTSFAMVYGVPAVLRSWLSRVGITVGVERPHPPAPNAKSPDLVVLPPAAATPNVGVENDVEPGAAVNTPPPIPAVRNRAAPPRARPTVPESAPDLESIESRAKQSNELYAHAHALHFVAKEPEAALHAWNAYLARAPVQPLRIEAEYNRALCLIRLHRKQEALQALAPFAAGAHGTYRQREARALVRALEISQPGAAQ